MKEHYHDRDTTCLKCPVACGKQYAITDGEFAGTRAKMPEYESIFALGPMLGIANPEALILANDLCDLLGMDTISMGVTLAFVCEALERGWLTPADVGVPFGWGDWRGMLKLVEMTARREGFGARLAEGAWRLAESVHPEGTRLVYAVKRLELPAHSARALKGLSIGYATATRGGSHHDTRPTPQYAPTFDRRGTTDKPAFAARSQNFTAVGDSLVLCRFTSERGFGLFVGEPYARMVRAVTGWNVDVEELERVGERIINLERMFNVREGVRRAQDVLPWKVMHEPIPEGPSAGMYCPPEELDAMLDAYYVLRGWSRDGVPTPAHARRPRTLTSARGRRVAWSGTALAAALLLSALGAVIVCLNVDAVRIHRTRRRAAAATARRQMYTRIGHALATTCFAGTAILIGMVLVRSARPVPPAVVHDARVPELDARIAQQASRVAEIEARSW